jgi:ribosomal protein L7/L12
MAPDHKILGPKVASEMEAFIAQGKLIYAINSVRAATGLGLAEAEDVVERTDRLIRWQTQLGLTPADIRRIRWMFTHDGKIPAIRQTRAATSLGLKEAKDFVDLTEAYLRERGMLPTPYPAAKATAHFLHQTVMTSPTPSFAGTERGNSRPTGRASGDASNSTADCIPKVEGGSGHENLTMVLAEELRHARRLAGEPSYALIMRRSERFRFRFSKPTLSRIFQGHSLPQWDTVETLLRAMEVSQCEIDTTWRALWLRAKEQRDPIGARFPALLAAVTPEVATEENPVAHKPPPSPRDGGEQEAVAKTAPPALSNQICEDCGLLIGDLVRHQAWHWNIEQQIRRATLRVVDDTRQNIS